MKTVICFLALAAAVNAGLIHHAPLPLSLTHSTGLSYGGLSGGLSAGLAYGGGLSHGGLSYGLGGGHQVVKVIHQEQAPLLVQAPVHHSTQVVKVIHQHAPAPVVLHHAPVVHHAPASVKIVKVLHQAPTGW